MSDDVAGLGHNQPPEETPPPPPRTLQEDLAERYAELVKRIAELNTLAAAAPLEVKDEETFKPLSDLLKAGRVAISMSEAARKIENEEARRRVQMIDAWFKNPADELVKLMKAVKERTDAYLDEKKAREEKARQAAAAEKARLAEEKRWDAIWAEARAELAAYDAVKAEEAQRAARLRKEAEGRRADHLRNRGKRLAKVEPYLALRAERRRVAAEAEAERQRKAAADEAARRAADADAKRIREELQARADADRARIADERARNAAAQEEAKKATAAARREENKLGARADKLEAQADEHLDEAEELGGEAGRLQKRADRAERHAAAGPAAMSRTRSELGTTSSLAKAWKVTHMDRNVIDLNLLRGFIHPDAIDVAVRGFMMAHKNDPGGPKLEGATFEQLEEGIYR